MKFASCLLLSIPFWLFAGCQQHSQQSQLPALEDREQSIDNLSGAEPSLLKVDFYNCGKIAEIEKADSPATRAELRRRLEDASVPGRLKLLYAGILAKFDDKTGQEFLIRRAKETIDYEECANTYYVFGHTLGWDGVHLRWAEGFIIDSMKNEVVVKTPSRYGHDSWSKKDLALSDFAGRFPMLLVEMKSPRAYDVLTELYEAAGGSVYLVALTLLNDPRSDGLFLRALEENRYPTGDEAACHLARKKDPTALEIFLKRIVGRDDSRIIYYLSQYHDDRILPAVKAALPQLKGQVRGEALLLIIELEGGDKLPRLLELAKSPPADHPWTAIDALEKIRALKDKRAIPCATELLRNSPDIRKRMRAYEILGEINDPVSIKALIDALSIDFHAVEPGWKGSDRNADCRRDIADGLKKLTGMDFGTDQAKWQDWYDKEPPK